MPQHFVCLTFDFDNASPMIAREMTTPTMISRGDFGMVATERLLALLAKHGDRQPPGSSPATPSRPIRPTAAAVFEAGHEIAHHGWTHRVPATPRPRGGGARAGARQRGDQALTGAHARGYRSPAWDLSPHSIELLLKHGFVYDSSLMGHDYLPYQARDGDVATLHEPIRYGPDTALVEMPISWSLDDYPVFEYMRTPTGIHAGPDERRAGAAPTGWPTSTTWPSTTTGACSPTPSTRT